MCVSWHVFQIRACEGTPSPARWAVHGIGEGDTLLLCSFACWFPWFSPPCSLLCAHSSRVVHGCYECFGCSSRVLICNFEVFPQQPERLGVLPIKLRGGLGQPPETLHQVPRGSKGMEPVPKWRFHSWNVRSERFRGQGSIHETLGSERFQSEGSIHETLGSERFRSEGSIHETLGSERFRSEGSIHEMLGSERFRSEGSIHETLGSERFRSEGSIHETLGSERFRSEGSIHETLYVRFREVPKWRFHSWNVRFREVPKSRFHSCMKR